VYGLWRRAEGEEHRSPLQSPGCGNCPEYLIEDSVLGRVDQILAKAETGSELEIIRYAS